VFYEFGLDPEISEDYIAVLLEVLIKELWEKNEKAAVDASREDARGG
jgi:hypothetical protein